MFSYRSIYSGNIHIGFEIPEQEKINAAGQVLEDNVLSKRYIKKKADNIKNEGGAGVFFWYYQSQFKQDSLEGEGKDDLDINRYIPIVCESFEIAHCGPIFKIIFK